VEAEKMEWIEVIRLRSAHPVQIPAWFRAEPGLENAAVYRGADLESDLSIVLTWRGQGPAGISSQGRLLAEALREFGWVNHNIWIKEEGK
jgi:hypothetical protein